MGAHKAIRFKQADVTRAVKGLQSAGIHDAEVRIDPRGNIRILIGSNAAKLGDGNDWDEVLQ